MDILNRVSQSFGNLELFINESQAVAIAVLVPTVQYYTNLIKVLYPQIDPRITSSVLSVLLLALIMLLPVFGTLIVAILALSAIVALAAGGSHNMSKGKKDPLITLLENGTNNTNTSDSSDSVGDDAERDDYTYSPSGRDTGEYTDNELAGTSKPFVDGLRGGRDTVDPR